MTYDVPAWADKRSYDAGFDDGRACVDEPKPDGWHTYHVCDGLLRELTRIDGGDLYCVACGVWFRSVIGVGRVSTEATERPDLEAALDELAEAFPVDEVSDAPWVAERGSIVWMVREGAGGPQIGNFILEADARWVADARNRAALTGATSPSEPSREDAVELTDGLDRPSGVYMCLACGSSVTPDPFNDGGGVDFGKREVYPIGSRTRCECPCHRNAGAAPEEERS
ncbi:MAG: hypothetical protein IT306_29540 [Chloroflexi bacterium]|nr:hypothetical protein [Chloroflexota bacterium]